MGHEGITFGEMPELFARLAADADPVLRGNFEKINGSGGIVPQRTHQGPPQAKTGA
jgi:hypothetical protein